MTLQISTSNKKKTKYGQKGKMLKVHCSTDTSFTAFKTCVDPTKIGRVENRYTKPTEKRVCRCNVITITYNTNLLIFIPLFIFHQL